MTNTKVQSQIKIQDNALPDVSFSALKANLLGVNFPWYYNMGINRPAAELVTPSDVFSESTEPQYNYQFTHSFIRDGLQNSQALDMLQPLLFTLGARCVFRLKANLSPRTDQPIVYGMHKDSPWDDANIALFYVNTTNGPTRFEDGTLVECVENRLVTFPNTMAHSGISCTDQHVRCVINVVYF